MSTQTRALAIRGDKTENALSKTADSITAELLRTLEAQHPDLTNAHSYRWFQRENFKNARNYYRALGVAHRQGRRDQVNFFAGAIVDLYHRDRAERASDALVDDVEPQRLDELPRRIRKRGNEYALRLKPIDSFKSVPHEIMSDISSMYLKSQDPPDQLLLGTYAQRYAPAMRDPIIYARYGSWYVKLGEWE